MKNKKFRRIKIGILGRQILTLLLMGSSLGLTMSARKQLWILKNIPKELKKQRKNI
jgi:phage terminase small subunit